MEANARYTNALRSLLVGLSEAGLGVDVVPAGDSRFDSKAVDEFVRIAVLFEGERPAGRLDEKWNTEVPFTIQADCFARSPAGSDVGAFDRVEQIADTLQDWLRNRVVSIKDYVGSNTTTTIAYLQLNFPRRLTLPGEDGFERRTIETPGYWFLQRGD